MGALCHYQCYAFFTGFVCKVLFTLHKSFLFLQFGSETLIFPGTNCQFRMKYCKMGTFSLDKFSLISPSKRFRAFNFHYSMAVSSISLIKVKNLEAFKFHTFGCPVEIAKIN